MRRRNGEEVEDALSTLSNTVKPAARSSVALAAVATLVFICVAVAALYTLLTKHDAQIFTPAELAAFDGKQQGPVYLALLGQVFDVTKGRKHYGPGGGYSFFSGRDASRAYVTGNFKEDLNDDVSDFTTEQLQSLIGWRNFYHKDYRQIGKLVGRFYDGQGSPTEALTQMEAQMSSEAQPKKVQLAAPRDAEACVEEQGWVYCESSSGHPRQVYHGAGQAQCICFGSTMFSNERRLYQDCAPNAHKCPVG